MDLLSTVLVPLVVSLLAWMLLRTSGESAVRPEPIRIERDGRRRRRNGR